MGMPVVTVASGGLPVVSVLAGGLPVTEAANKFGRAVTQVVSGGLPVNYGSPFIASKIDNVTIGTGITLSNGNLTATSTGATATGARSNVSHATGKYYFEIQVTNWSDPLTSPGMAIAGLPFSSYTSQPSGGLFLVKNGGLWLNGSNIASMGARSSNDIIGFAADFTAELVWVRVAPSGNWNASGTANPATGVGGGNLSPAMIGACYAAFGCQASGQQAIFNFGASAFSGAVPAGFAAGF